MTSLEITISKTEYDALREKLLILNIVERTVRNDSDAYGYSSNTRVILEAVLGINREKKEKAD